MLFFYNPRNFYQSYLIRVRERKDGVYRLGKYADLSPQNCP